ncbi:MAG: JAB domain-containing protein [Dyadobacter sp.]
MRKVGELLNIRVLDHLIVTAEGFCSFADDGFM